MNSDALSISFWLFFAGVAAYVALLLRFVTQLIRSQLASPEEIEAFSQLILSGGGGVRAQWLALMYLLRRKYAQLDDEVVVKAGDYALLSFCFAFVLMLVWCFIAIFN